MRLYLLFFLLFPAVLFSQGFTSYFTGNPTNISTITEPGTCLMGGATEHDNAMIWLLEKANGGDVVVLRSSGSDGYNDYLYSELGVNINSVETLVITSVAGATNPYVLDKVANAEMIWFAGGDQWNYVSYFKDNALEDLLNSHVNVKHAPIGGTSAGMAILGSRYFSAENGSITSATALNNPYHPNITLGNNDFISVPFLENVTTDTHFDNPDRKGRLVTFMARTLEDGITQYPYGIGANEYVAICIEENGHARVFGDYPNYEEFAYFAQTGCQIIGPEVIEPGVPLTWNAGGMAVSVYKVPGTMNGDNYYDLSSWLPGTGEGGSWEYWTVSNGVLNESPGVAPSCLGIDDFSEDQIAIYPVPFQDELTVSGFSDAEITITDISGRQIFKVNRISDSTFDTSDLTSGIYIISVKTQTFTVSRKIIKL